MTEQPLADHDEAIGHVVTWLAGLNAAFPGAYKLPDDVAEDWAVLLLEIWPSEFFDQLPRRAILRACSRFPSLAEMIPVLQSHREARPDAAPAARQEQEPDGLSA